MVNISKREEELPGSVIDKLNKIASENKSIISLGPGEPDFITPKPILDYAKKIIDKATHYSPNEGRKEFLEAAVKKLRKENKIKCNTENVIATTGSAEGILLTLATTIDPTEEVIIPSPGYLGYLPAIELLSGFPVPLQLLEEDEFDIDFSKLQRLIDKKTKAIIINTPGNPTGTIFSKKTLEALADVAVENDILVFSDEAYEAQIYDKEKHISFASLNGMLNHSVTWHSFSKSHAMPGFRIGYATGPAKIIKAMTKIHTYTTVSAPTISQMIGAYALSIPKKYINDMTKEYDKRRKVIWKRLNDLELPTCKPQGAFYTFSNVKHLGLSSLDLSKHLLKHAKVAVVPGSEFGIYGEGFIRCSYATDLHLIEKAMDKIEIELEKLKKSQRKKFRFIR